MNDSNRRLFITIFLCLLVAYAWSIFVDPKLNPPVPAAEQLDAGPAAVALQAPPPVPVHPTSDVPRGTSTPVQQTAEVPLPRPPTKIVTLSSALLRVELTSDGAAIRSAQLLGAKYLHAPVHGAERKPVELVAPNTNPLPLSIEVAAGLPGALAALPGTPALPVEAGYEVVDQGENSVMFRAHTAAGLEVDKRISLLPNSYKLEVQVQIHSAQPFNGRASLITGSWSDPASGGGGFLSSYFSARIQPSQAICKAGKEMEQLQVAKPKSMLVEGLPSFVGINDQFFLLALVPSGLTGSACRLESAGTGGLDAILDAPVALPAGGSTKFTVGVYAGPKLAEILDQASPDLRDSIDFGFWGLIVKVLLKGLQVLHDTIPPHNWGLAIILLTVAIKLLTFPLTQKQMKSMQEMQRIQPQLEEMKKKFAGDTARQNQEQMKLFQEHGVNPMASCLPDAGPVPDLDRALQHAPGLGRTLQLGVHHRVAG